MKYTAYTFPKAHLVHYLGAQEVSKDELIISDFHIFIFNLTFANSYHLFYFLCCHSVGSTSFDNTILIFFNVLLIPLAAFT